MRTFTKRARSWCAAALFGSSLAAAGTPAAAQTSWPQWGRTPQHGGASPVLGQPLEAILASVVYDPFVEQMKEETGGLLAHYAVPLVNDTGVYMVFKSGVYTGLGSWDSLTWSVKKLQWIGGRLEVVWTFESDWKPEPLTLTAWESVFLPAISGHDIYVPGLGGTVFRVATETGISEGRVNPFGDIDPDRYVAGGLAVAPDGSVVYNVIGLSTPDPLAPITGAWLVKIEQEGDASSADFATLVPGAPSAHDPCQSTFPQDQRPWPPSTTATPPTVPCGAQRPGINVVPAIAPDGTIYTVSRAHGADRYGYLVAVHPDLTPAWTASFRGILNDGCGVLLQNDNTNRGCRAGANLGVDPATNDRPAGRVRDAGTSSPVVLPDGAILIGTSTSYNFSRGHLFKFSAEGSVLATYDFGWDITPAFFEHDGTYSILIKDNHYSSPDGVAYYDVSSLDADLVPLWSFRATNTESCVRQPGGEIVCVDDHPEGFEWCVNQPALDAAGVAYLNGEDGVLYAFDRDGHVLSEIFLDTALGAAYTPLSIGPDGVVYTQNNGVLFAVGRASSAASAPRGTPEPAAGDAHFPRVVERE
jgi:hypothetical protein